MSGVLGNQWEDLNVANNVIFSARQGCGVAQFTHNKILLIGGFHGKFSNETFFLNVDKDKHSIEKSYHDI